MTQCYHCGSSIISTDRFCMECGTEDPAHPPEAHLSAALATDPNPGPAQARTPGAEASTIIGDARLAQAARAAQVDDTIACPNCGSRLPRGARFCGDCGTRLAEVSTAVPAPARSSRVAAAALPDPIPPLHASAEPKPASGPVQPVLPPFHAGSRAAPSLPEAEPPEEDTTTIVPPGQPAALPPAQAAPVWSGPPPNQPAAPPQAAPAAWANPAPGQPVGLLNQPAMPPQEPAAPAWGSPPASAPWSAPPQTWQPGQPPGTSKAASFQPPHTFPPAPTAAAPVQGPGPQAPGSFPPQPPQRALPLQPQGLFPPQPAAGSASPSQAPFMQKMASMPPIRGAPRKRRYPRGQVITMIVAAIVTVLAALGGLLLHFAAK